MNQLGCVAAYAATQPKNKILKLRYYIISLQIYTKVPEHI